MDGTDLFNVSVTDIYSWKYNLAVGETGTSYVNSLDTTIVGDIGEQFSFDGTTLTLEFVTNFVFSEMNSIYSIDDLGNTSGISTENGFLENLYMGYVDSQGIHHAAVSQFPIANAQFIGVENIGTTNGSNPIPEPSILALMGLGIVGLGFVRRRKLRQS